MNYTKGGYFYPPLGGASRAFGLPQAAAKRILRAEARTHFCPVQGIRWLRHKTVESEGTPCRGRVGPVCRFEGRGGGGAPVEGISAALGRVWGGSYPEQL